MAPSTQIDIYPVEESVKRKRKALAESALPRQSVDLILRFVDKLAADGLTAHRQSFYLTQLKGLAEILGAAFPNPSKQDIKRAVAEIEGRPYRDWTKSNYKTALRQFYRWRLSSDEGFPLRVEWVRTRRTDNDQLPEGLLTRPEVEAMVQACKNPRDRALISCLAASGLRIGELLSLGMGDVAFDQHGVIFRVSGKTGDRHVRIAGDAVLYLVAWIEFHPHRDDPNAPLWAPVGERVRGEPLSYAASHKVLKTAAKRAGIKKRVHAQLFRHIRETELARKVREASWEDQMVRDRDSEIAKAFVPLPRGDADRVLLGAEETEFLTDEKGVARELPKACPRCEAINQHDSAFCRRCGVPLTVEALEDPGSGVEKMQGPPEAVVAIPSRTEAPDILTQLDIPMLLLGVLILFLGILLGPPYSTFSNIAWLLLVVGGTLTAINVVRGY